MRDWLIVQLVLGTLMVALFTCVGLLALWAATSRWHWFARTAIVLGVLSPLLLRPMYEPVVTLAVQVCVIVVGVRAYSQRALLWETLRGRRRIPLPRFSIQFLLAATCVVAIGIAVAVAATARLGSTFWIAPASMGVVVGLTTLFAAWLTRPQWSWKSLLIVFVALGLLSYAYEVTDYFGPAAPVVNFWPHRWPDASILPTVVNYLRAFAHVTSATALQYAFLLGWSRLASPGVGGGRPRAHQRVGFVIATLVLAAFPVYVIAKLQFPYPVPEQLSFPGDDDRFRDLLALEDNFKGTALWREICADQMNMQTVATAVQTLANEFDELHRLLDKPISRPVTVHWAAENSMDFYWDGWRKMIDENGQLTVFAHVLAARSEASRTEGDIAAAVESALALLRLANSTSRAVDFSTHLRAVAFQDMAIRELYCAMPFFSEPQCEDSIQSLVETENRRQPIARLLRYHRAESEHVFGWSGQFMVVLGDIVNQLNPSLDVNHAKLLQDIDRRSQTQVRLLITELLLRRHYLRTNEYPETLERLTAGELSAWFSDPFAANHDAFVYRREDGGYVLYSVGVDGDDDGGRPPARGEYGSVEWRDDGDLRLDVYFAEADEGDPSAAAAPDEEP